MMNKRSARLIAWLLTLMMVLNIVPMSALAVSSERYYGPELQTLGELSSGSVPNQTISDYKVQYVIKGEYTYDGNHLIIKTENGKKGNPSQEEPEQTPGCSTADKNTATWDEVNRVLTFYPVPNTCSVELRYMLIFTDASGNLVTRTFQQIGNGEAGLGKDENGQFETIEFKKFNGGTDSVVLTTINDVSIKQILPFDVPLRYIQLDSIEQTTWGRDYTIEYYGSSSGLTTGQNTPIENINRSETIHWAGESEICLFFLVGAANEESVYHTVQFVNYDGTLLYETKVKHGNIPVYFGSKPTKPADSQHSFEYTGWDKEIVPATEDAVYTAQYT